MNYYPEEIIIHFVSYASIPFKTEIYADDLTIDWGEGPVAFTSDSHYFSINHSYRTEGYQKITIRGHGITYADVSRLSLTELILSNCPYLEYLNCSVNELSSLDLNQCPILEELHCNSNNLQQLDLSKTPSITTLNASCNVLENIILQGCKALQTLYCTDNHLQSLNLPDCPNISYIDISGNLLDTYSINTLFNQLPSKQKKENPAIYCMENPGFEFCNKDLLITKRWR